MSQYFDKNFFKLLFIFVAIILISLLSLAAENRYKLNNKMLPAPNINIAQPKS